MARKKPSLRSSFHRAGLRLVDRSARRTVDRAEQKRIPRESRVAARERWRDGSLCDSARSSGPSPADMGSGLGRLSQGATLGQAQRQIVTVTGFKYIGKSHRRSQARITTGHTFNANYDRLSKKNTVYAEEDKEKRLMMAIVKRGF